MPDENYALLKCLCDFLFRVSQRAEKNKMNAYNLATVFAPTLCRPQKEEDMSSAVRNAASVNAMVEFLISSGREVRIQYLLAMRPCA
jgi:hypothetical protein